MNESDYNFEYKYSLFEIKEDSSYLIVFIPMNTIDNNMIEKQFIKKFRFKSFDSETYEEINSINYNDYLNSTIINVFFMDDFGILVSFFCVNCKLEKDYTVEPTTKVETGDPPTGHSPGRSPTLLRALTIGNKGRDSKTNINLENKYELQGFISGKVETFSSRRKLENNQKYNFNLYGKNLNYLKCFDYPEFNFQVEELLYFKSIYLGNQYIIFSFIVDSNKDYINFNLIEIDIDSSLDVNYINIVEKYLYNFDNYNESLSDFIKIEENKLVFIYTGSFLESNSNKIRLLSMIIININLKSFTLSTKVYSIQLETLIPKLQLSAHIYNGYILFATTAIEENPNSRDDYFSLLIIFGYANGTDSTIDIFII